MHHQNRDKLVEEWERIIELRAPDPASEWVTKLSYDAIEAFLHHLDIASILTTTATIETLLRLEDPNIRNFRRLIERSKLNEGDKLRLNSLRAYRNQWVHVNKPFDDEHLHTNTKNAEEELSYMAKTGIEVMYTLIYDTPVNV
ncbi:MAG: hypothetical protein GVY36_04100 [Verrucomicrobia bacterium]|jgi:uncharacterized protein YutE (UPF0331/DUF86 family)|nr:hypothetical protein [Verrucomicrobiota bacterium]